MDAIEAMEMNNWWLKRRNSARANSIIEKIDLEISFLQKLESKELEDGYFTHTKRSVDEHFLSRSVTYDTVELTTDPKTGEPLNFSRMDHTKTNFAFFGGNSSGREWKMRREGDTIEYQMLESFPSSGPTHEKVRVTPDKQVHYERLMLEDGDSVGRHNGASRYLKQTLGAAWKTSLLVLGASPLAKILETAVFWR